MPFKDAGVLHEECLRDVTTGNFWCPTQLNDEQEYVHGQGNWGFCSPSCPPFEETKRKTSSKKSSIDEGATFTTDQDGWKGV